MRKLTGSLGNSVAADKMASSLSIRSIRSMVLSDRISSMSCIDSVKLGGSEFRGENVVGPGNELSDGTLSKLGYSWSTVSGSMSSSESLFDLFEWKYWYSEGFYQRNGFFYHLPILANTFEFLQFSGHFVWATQFFLLFLRQVQISANRNAFYYGTINGIIVEFTLKDEFHDCSAQYFCLIGLIFASDQPLRCQVCVASFESAPRSV